MIRNLIGLAIALALYAWILVPAHQRPRHKPKE